MVELTARGLYSIFHPSNIISVFIQRSSPVKIRQMPRLEFVLAGGNSHQKFSTRLINVRESELFTSDVPDWLLFSVTCVPHEGLEGAFRLVHVVLDDVPDGAAAVDAEAARAAHDGPRDALERLVQPERCNEVRIRYFLETDSFQSHQLNCAARIMCSVITNRVATDTNSG